MEFFTRVLSGNSRLKERAREAEQLNQTFKANLDNLKILLESEESEDLLALLDMVYDSSFPEEQVFMKTPSRARLKSKKELVVRLLIGLDSLGVPVMAEMLVFVRKHGPEAVADSLMTLLEFLSPLLEGKEAPDFSTDDVMDAMDFEWHSTSRVGSPLLNVISSATSSPRASAALIGDSPLHPIMSASPYRRAISDRSMLVSPAHELGAKLVLDKPSATASMPPRHSLTMSASLQYPSANQDFRFSQPTILEAPASPEIIQDSTDEKPSSYSLDTLPASSQHGLQRKHRRKSSSLQQLFTEGANDELSREGSVGDSAKRYSSSSSWRRNSTELTKIITDISETSSPMNPGLDAGDFQEGASVALDKEFLSSIHTQDRHVNRSSRKGSRRISPSPSDEGALWREDSGGFSVDLVPSNKNAAQTLVDAAGRVKAPHEDGRPLVLHYLLEAEVHAVEGVDALKPLENELELQSLSNGDVQEDARQAPSPQANKEDAGRTSSENFYQDAGHVDTHEELHAEHNVQDDAGRAPSSIDDYHQHAHSFDTLEEDAGHALTHIVQYSSDEYDDHLSSHDSNENAGHGHTLEEVAVHTHTHEEDARHTYSSTGTCDQDAGYTHDMADNGQDGCKTASDKITPEEEGYGFQWILAPSLLPSSSNVSQVVDDQAGDISLENDKDINSSGGSSGDKREDRELHAAISPSEDLQEAGDVKPSRPLQDQRQVDIQLGSHTDVPVQSCVMDITNDTCLAFTQCGHEMVNEDLDEDGVHLHFVSSNDAATLSHADVPPTNGVIGIDNNELSDDQHALHHVKKDEHLKELPSLDDLNMRSTTWADCADSNSTLEAPSFLESLPMLGEVCLEEISQSKGDQSSMQEALEMKDENSPGEELNAQNSSLVEGGNSSLATDSFNHISLIENIKAEMPELIREDEKKENVQPLDVHVDNVSGPYAVTEQLKVSDNEFEKLLSELDAADSGVFCESGELPLIGDTEGGQMGMYRVKNMGEKTQEEQFDRGLDKEKLQWHAGSVTVDNAADGDMHAGLMASLEDHEYEQANKLSHVFPLSNKTDAPAADYTHLHGQPPSSSTLSHMERSDQHVLNQSASLNDPTMDRWDMDTNVPRSKRKGGCMGKWARGCLSCCTKPHTNS